MCDDRPMALVDVFYYRPPALRVYLPAAPSDVGESDPFPGLGSFWEKSKRLWGWKVDDPGQIDAGVVVDLIERTNRGRRSPTR